MQNRAYSVLEIRAVNEDQRVITGIATTPSTDRMGDVVEPLGVKFKNPMPLLWQHQSDKPVGTVRFDPATDKGITFTATLPKIDEPGVLKDRCDEAWDCVRLKLVRGVSIGFRAIEYAYIDGGGIRFVELEVYELSLVTIPANAQATIQTIKSIDTTLMAAQATAGDASKRRGVAAIPAAAGAPTVKKTAVRSNPSGTTMKTIAEQIAGFQATRAHKSKQMGELLAASDAKGETLDAEQDAQYDELNKEVEAIDKQIKRLEAFERSQAVTANSVDVDANRNAKQLVGNGEQRNFAQAKNTQKQEPGIAFARYAKCLAISHLHHRNPVEIARAAYPDDPRLTVLFEKAAVAAANTLNSTWAGALVGDEGTVFADFVEFLRPQTIVGRFGSNGIPSLRRVPFRTPLIGQTSGGAGYWVGEGKPKPVTKFDFVRTTLEPLKVANIAVATKELLRDSSPSADLLIRDSLAAALRDRLDTDFIDPAKAVSAGVSPASITNGATTVASSGTDADAVRCDIQALFGAFIAANNAPTSGVWVMPATTALALSLMQNPLGQSEFPGINMNGGTLFGLPVIVSEYVPSASAGAIVALVNASDIYLADEGGISIDMSTEASLQMDDSPTNASVSGGSSDTVVATSMVSLWQTNSVGFLAERTINWARRRTSAVAYLTDVLWGACGS